MNDDSNKQLSAITELQKELAEKTRQLEIEAALEKVRARSLTIYKSEDFTEVIKIVYEQLQELGLHANAISINIAIEKSDDTEVFICGALNNGLNIIRYRLPYFNQQIANDRVAAFRSGLDFFAKTYDKKTKDAFYAHAFELSDLRYAPEDIKQLINNSEAYSVSLAMAKHSMIVVNDFEGKKLLEPEVHILKRFVKVFEQAYIRFLDLQKAEAHAVQAEQALLSIKAARKKAEEALSELQVTQNQLIQKEKMASLGELTAGIAHEIQNPLNFVNNFSEVSKELLEELKEALEQGNKGEAAEIANDIIQNLEKIHHHGKRADAIVKGMLQHSRKSEGTKESTNINKLVDEYLRLAYQGLRAKDKHFNTELSTHFDERIGNVNMVPQDIGSVLLNLYNNAFYAVNERKKKEGNGYKPLVVVQTKREKDSVVITVRDNGNGIPQNIVGKIFQPFFTTKPTGQGTGLGLSLAYDIIKAHAGEIKVESKEGEGSAFVIYIPVP